MSVGTYSEFVDTQNVIVTNITDGKTYTQTRMVNPFRINHEMVEHHLTTGYVEKLPSLESSSVQIVALLTEPELDNLTNLCIVVNGKLPIKEWKVNYVSFKNGSTLLKGFAKMFEFQIMDRGQDIVVVSFRLEFESDMVGLDKAVVTPV